MVLLSSKGSSFGMKWNWHSFAIVIAFFSRSVGAFTQSQMIVVSHLFETEDCVSLLSLNSWRESDGFAQGSGFEDLLCWLWQSGVYTGVLVIREECSVLLLRS